MGLRIVIAHTWWKKLLHKFFPWALNRLIGVFLFLAVKLEFLLSSGIK